MFLSFFSFHSFFFSLSIFGHFFSLHAPAHNLLTYWFLFLYHLSPLSLPFQLLSYLFSGRRNISFHLIFPTHTWIMLAWTIILHLSTKTTLPWWPFSVFFFLFPQNAALSHLLTLQVCAHFSQIRHQIISDRASRSIISAEPCCLQIYLFSSITATLKQLTNSF